jgi:hypothetical protein
MDAVLERGSVADQRQPPSGAFALGPDLGGGQPDLGDQVAAGQLGQDPSVGPVGLAGQRGQALDLLGVGDGDLPAGQLELVMDEPGAAHRLDRCPHRLSVGSVWPTRPRSPSASGGAVVTWTMLALGIEQVHVQPVA